MGLLVYALVFFPFQLVCWTAGNGIHLFECVGPLITTSRLYDVAIVFQFSSLSSTNMGKNYSY
jgi:hypothetical protein